MKITPLKHVNVCLFRHPSLNVSPKNPPCKNFCDIWPIKLHFPKSPQRWEARVNERQSKCLPASLACLCPPDMCMLCEHLPLSWMLHRHKFLICWIGSTVPQYCSSKYLAQKCSLFTYPAYQVPNVSSVYLNNVLVYSWKHSGKQILYFLHHHLCFTYAFCICCCYVLPFIVYIKLCCWQSCIFSFIHLTYSIY